MMQEMHEKGISVKLKVEQRFQLRLVNVTSKTVFHEVRETLSY